MKTKATNSLLPANHIARIALGTAIILAIPLVAMQFSNGVDWDETDFLVIGVLLFGTGLLYELLAHKLKNRNQRLMVAAVLVLLIMYLWAELAVGIFTHWGS